MIRFVIFDVDDVLLEMNRSLERAERSILAPLSQIIGAGASAVQARFSEIYATMIAQLRRPPGDVDPRAAEVRRKINHWQRGLVSAGHEIKPWSRETMLAIALEEAGHRPTTALIRAASDRYWETVAREASLFPDAAEIIGRLRARNVDFHLATNSDGFVELHEEWQTFFYDPRDAAARKIGRMQALKALGIEPAQITVGDPIGKPASAFYQRVVADFSARLSTPLPLAETLAVGDSLTHDVLPFAALGATGALLVRAEDARRALVPPEAAAALKGTQVVGSLTELDALVG